jgi:hypothetical protein
VLRGNSVVRPNLWLRRRKSPVPRLLPAPG